VKQHEGHIDVKSQVNVGTTFSIYLPTLILQVPPRIDKGPANLIRGRGEKMLVVEDDPALRLAMVEMLTLLDYQVMEAANGQEALTVLAKHGHAIELVLSDMVMPEMGGIALLQTLRQQGWTKPVILLTGHPLDQELAVLQAHDVQALLLKPPSLEQLTRTIAEALKERVKS
jgi:CheY-like chemotaxis protein